MTGANWDPVPHLAALIDGVRQLLDGEDKYATDIYDRIGALATGPYAALRGGLLLDEPGRETVSTEAALRTALGELMGEAWRTQRDALDAYARQNADVHRENTRLRDEIARLRDESLRACDEWPATASRLQDDCVLLLSAQGPADLDGLLARVGAKGSAGSSLARIRAGPCARDRPGRCPAGCRESSARVGCWPC